MKVGAQGPSVRPFETADRKEPTVRPSAEQNPSLDGIRGLAFVLVALFHLNDFLHRPWFLVDGQVGVWIFFVLSSYLLAKPFFSEPSCMGKWGTWWRYAIRRFLRIFPLFAIYAACLLVFAHVPLSKCLRVFLLERTHAVDWSLYIECRFYLLLPLLVLPAAWVGHRAYLIFLITVIAATTWFFPFWADFRTWPFSALPMAGVGGDAVFLSYLSCFLPGIVAAYASVHFPPRMTATGLVADIASIAALLAIISIPLLRQSGPQGHPLEYSRLIHLWLPYAGLFAGWIYLVDNSKGVFAKLLANRVWRFLGSISYPGYLFNIFVYYELRRFLPEGDVVFAIISSAVLLLITYLLHRAVEMPIYRLRPKH